MTWKRSFTRLLIGFAATAALAACADSPTSPAQTQGGYNVPAGAEPSNSLLGGLLGGLLQPVSVAKRTTPLASAITVSTVATPWGGGSLSIPAAGLKVVIPPGAVSSTMTITVTALAGNLIAYDFGPSGTKFNVPLQITQSTGGTTISLLSALLGGLHAAYFANDSQINFSSGTALINELLPLNLGALLGTVQFNVSHFSGYLIAGGNSADPSDSGGIQSDARRVIIGGGSH